MQQMTGLTVPSPLHAQRPQHVQGWAVGLKGGGKDSHRCCGFSADGGSGLQALSLLRVLGRPTLGVGCEAWARGGLRWR